MPMVLYLHWVLPSVFLNMPVTGPGRDMPTMFPATSQLPVTSANSHVDPSRPASASHLHVVPLRKPAVTPERYGASAVSRLAPKVAGPVQHRARVSGTEASLRPDGMNNQRQRVMEWQMKSQIANAAENVGQPQPGRLLPANPTAAAGETARPNYYPFRPQSQFIEPQYAVSSQAVAASPLPQSISMPDITDSVMANRSQTAGFEAQPSPGEMVSVSRPAYSVDPRYGPQQVQPTTYEQQPGMALQPRFHEVPPIRPPMAQMVRQPLQGMGPQGVQHSGPAVRSEVPDACIQHTVTVDRTQYQPLHGSTDVSNSEQWPTDYRSQPQSQLIEPGHAVFRPSQSTSMPAITPSAAVGNRSQTAAGFEPQTSGGKICSAGRPAYSEDPRYRPQHLLSSAYDQQFVPPAQPQFNLTAYVKPQTSEISPYPLPGMVPDMQHSAPNIHLQLPDMRQHPAVSGNEMQYEHLSAAQYGAQGARSGAVASQAGVQYGATNVDPGVIPVVSTADGRPVNTQVVPGVFQQRPSLPPDMRYEMGNLESRAVPAGVQMNTDGRPHAASEREYVDYEPQNVTAVTSSVRPVALNVPYGTSAVSGQIPPAVYYDSSSIQGMFVEAKPVSSFDAPRDQPSAKFSHQGGCSGSLNLSYSSLEAQAPYNMQRATAVSTNAQFGPSSPSISGDGWPPPPNDRYGASNVQSEFSVSPSVSVPLSSRLPAPQSTSDSSQQEPSEVRPRLLTAVSPMPGAPTNNIRPKKQPPPVAAKPKLPVGARMALKTKEVATDGGKQLKPERIQQKLVEIQRLESRPYLTANEQTRLQNLHIEVEFDRRLADTSERHEEGAVSEQSMMQPSSDQLHVWPPGQMMPVHSIVPSAEPYPSAATSYTPNQTSTSEQRPGAIAPYAAVNQAEGWNQYDPVYGQAANSDIRTTAEYRQESHDSRPNATSVSQAVGEGEPADLDASAVTVPSARVVSSSALRQPTSTPGSGKKTVTFHENIATEYAIRQSYGSTSSEGSLIPLSPPDNSGVYGSMAYWGGPVHSYNPSVPH